MTIQPAIVKFEKAAARELWQTYKKHLHYAKPIDKEIGRAYQLLAQGRLIIRLFDSMKAAGQDAKGYPKLAIARADWKQCFCTIHHDGSAMFVNSRWSRGRAIRYDFPSDTFARGNDKRPHSALTVPPVIPLHLRPRRGLQNYAILWEAEWTPVPPHDPLLLRRIGKSDLWLVVAQWDLTSVERGVLATRVRA